jgi:hypothetical protein
MSEMVQSTTTNVNVATAERQPLDAAWTELVAGIQAVKFAFNRPLFDPEKGTETTTYDRYIAPAINDGLTEATWPGVQKAIAAVRPALSHRFADAPEEYDVTSFQRYIEPALREVEAAITF